MPKPTFLKVGNVAGKPVSAGAASLGASQAVTVEIPIRLPEGYPSNRTLQAWVVDQATGATAGSANVKLDPGSLKKRSDGASMVEVALPAIARTGSFALTAKLISEVSGDKSARQMLPSPVACSTDIAQPEKALSCRLLSLQVR